MDKKGFKITDSLVLIFLVLFFGLIFYGLYANNRANKETDLSAKERMQRIQAVIEDYYVSSEQYPNNSSWSEEVEKKLGSVSLDEFTYNINGAGSGCYSLSYTLLNPKDSGANITNGVYILECKQ